MKPAAVRDLLGHAERMVDAARAVVLRRLKKGLAIRTKADDSYVTDADTAAENVLRAAIARSFPGHGIIGEEFPPVNTGSDFQWIADPIDGTLSFTRGIPLYGIILALHHEGRPVLGVIDHPGLGLRVSAAAGLGCRRNGKPLRMDARALPIEREIIATGDRGHFIKMGREKAFDALVRRHPLVRSYADCFGHTLAAQGAVGAMVDYGVKIWDIGASQVIIEEAGGKYVVAETKDSADGTLYGVVCGKPKVVDWAVKLLR